MIDTVELKILNIIQSDGRISNAELARRLDMAPSGILERVKKLEKKGIISGYEVRLDPDKLGLGITAFIQVLTSDTVGSTEVGSQLARMAEIQEVHWIAGDYNYLIKARLGSSADLPGLLKKFGAIAGLRDTRTTLVLETLKQTQTLPLELLSPHIQRSPKNDLNK